MTTLCWKVLAQKHNYDTTMKVLQSIPFMVASQGGPSTCTCDLLQGLYENGAKVDLLTSACQNPKDRNLGEGSEWLKEVTMDYRTPLALSKATNRYLRTTEYDLYHANTLWLYPVHATCAYARKVGKPYVLSTHGMLYPTALAVSGWKKRLMGALWYNKDIRHATCLHATCEAEMEYNRKWGYKGPIAVIPNPVVFPEYVRELPAAKPNASADGKCAIGFLGRLHPIKKVENIVYALSLLTPKKRKAVRLDIMGKYDDKYEQWLKDEVGRFGLEDSVEFVGFVSGEEKYERLRKLSALMVPSAQENFGMIVPEALICETPVYASLGTPWSELNDCHCGWWRDNKPETIAGVISEMLEMTDEQLQAMGRNGRKLMEEKYEQHKVAAMMQQLYDWIGGGMKMGEKPSFVYL